MRGRGPDQEKGYTMFSKLRAAAVAIVAVGLLTFVAAPAAFASTGSTAKATSTSRTAARPPIQTPVWTFHGLDAAGNEVVTGTFTPTHFSQVGGVVSVTGLLTADGTTQTITDQITDPTCPVLHLVLGPLTLNLLGLNVSLNQVVLDITATSGPGNLLGNLLCAVANLLNGSGSTTALQNLLNQLNALLGSL